MSTTPLYDELVASYDRKTELAHRYFGIHRSEAGAIVREMSELFLVKVEKRRKQNKEKKGVCQTPYGELKEFESWVVDRFKAHLMEHDLYAKCEKIYMDAIVDNIVRTESSVFYNRIHYSDISASNNSIPFRGFLAILFLWFTLASGSELETWGTEFIEDESTLDRFMDKEYRIRAYAGPHTVYYYIPADEGNDIALSFS